MSIHEHLRPQARKDLQQVGWTKGLELAKVARKDGQEFDCATWLHKAHILPKKNLKGKWRGNCRQGNRALGDHLF
jgi:hypothetical protein